MSFDIHPGFPNATSETTTLAMTIMVFREMSMGVRGWILPCLFRACFVAGAFRFLERHKSMKYRQGRSGWEIDADDVLIVEHASQNGSGRRAVGGGSGHRFHIGGFQLALIPARPVTHVPPAAHHGEMEFRIHAAPEYEGAAEFLFAMGHQT